MAFALNEALAERWRKVPSVDSLGNPNFDGVAITSSRIGIESSIDTYRLGKSLRKKGFTSAATDTHPSLADSADALATALTSRLNGWIDTDAPVRVDVPDAGLTAPRRWVCDLPDGTATVPCGGTHVQRLSALGQVQVAMSLNDDHTVLTIVTTPTP
jgi:alanyl-tRNA synthetase